MKEKFAHFGLLWLRLLTGVGIALHGFDKMFGEGGMERIVQEVEKMVIFGNQLPMPTLFAWLAAIAELLGGALLVVGFKTRLGALLIFCTMSMAVFVTHAGGALSAKELALAYWTLSGAILFLGGGKISLDSLKKKGGSKKSSKSKGKSKSSDTSRPTDKVKAKLKAESKKKDS